jgi:hypothetical protein
MPIVEYLPPSDSSVPIPEFDSFFAAVSTDHRAVVEVQVWYRGAQTGTVQPLSGSVTVDRGRDTRRQLNGVTFADPDGLLVPTDPTSLLAPYGQQLRVFRGVRVPSGDVLAPLGVFRILKTNVEAPSGVVSVEADDLSYVVRRNRWTTPWQVGAVDAADAIADILTDRFAEVEIDFELTGYTVGVGVLESGSESDPWRDAQDIARAAGYELAFGPDGVARLYAPASPDQPATATYGPGTVILTASREVDATETYNGVYAYGESSALPEPVYAEAWDEDPASPTYRYGPFGEVPRFFASPFITTTDQAESAAESLLAQVTGSAEAVTWTQIVNPAHDVDDVIDLAVDQLHLSARIVLDTLDIPLLATDAMSATARVRRFG